MAPNSGSPTRPSSATCPADFATLAAARPGRGPRLPAPDVVLDVRLTNEWNAGHLAGAVHIPLPELRQRMADLPPGVVWVHCRSGYRATIAASLLAAAGRQVVLVDDHVDQAARAGLELTGATA